MIRRGLWSRIEAAAARSNSRSVLLTVTLAMCGLLAAVSVALGTWWLVAAPR
jgi:hypothetical protein